MVCRFVFVFGLGLGLRSSHDRYFIKLFIYSSTQNTWHFMTIVSVAFQKSEISWMWLSGGTTVVSVTLFVSQHF